MDGFPELGELFKKLTLELYPDYTFTENSALAFATTGSACLDFFGSIVRRTRVSTAIQDFIAAWNEDPDKTLRLVLNLRDISNGKGEKKLSLVLLYVLSCWKPLTYLANLTHMLDLGCYKDLLTIAELAVRMAEVKGFTRFPALQNKHVELKVIATQLSKDEVDLKGNEKAGITLCAKWAPSGNGHYNKAPLRFSHRIGKLIGVTKKDYRVKLTNLRGHLKVLERMMCNNQWDQIVFSKIPAKAHRIYRDAFKRDYNAKVKVSEERRKVSARYAEYLQDLMSGKETIKSTGTQPHELIEPYLQQREYLWHKGDAEKEDDLTIEGQWNDMISKLADSGHFRHCQAVCDVSGSMRGLPMQVAIALGLVVAELTDTPFNNKLITFSQNPKFHTVLGTSLREKVQNVMNMEWGMNTDFLKVFQVMLEAAAEKPQAQMPEKLFVFTDMQFDAATQNQEHSSGSDSPDLSSDEQQTVGQNGWKTTYHHIQQMYEDKGCKVPHIIFWNLQATGKTFAVDKDQPGTSLMSGFSAEMMRSFLDAADLEEMTPMTLMDDILQKYSKATVPEVERTPITTDEEFAASLSKVEQIVKEYLVPKTVKNGRRKPRPTRRKKPHPVGQRTGETMRKLFNPSDGSSTPSVVISPPASDRDEEFDLYKSRNTRRRKRLYH